VNTLQNTKAEYRPDGQSAIPAGLKLHDLWACLLVQHGFIIPRDENGTNIRKLYMQDPVTGLFRPKAAGAKINPKHALQEFGEQVSAVAPLSGDATEYIPTSYPATLMRYHVIYETPTLSLEDNYFWFIDHIRYDQGFTRAYKIRDIFSSSEHSAFFGAAQQRLGIQQDRVQQYLATIGKMTKDLFQLVRELRILDEKLLPRKDWKKLKAADATLKAEFIDLVENRGGQTSPSSVYGLSQQLGYGTLPDLFFNTYVYDLESVDKVVDKLDFNKNVKAVLNRKLYQFINWKLKTDHELESRKTFTLKYLRQHWDIIEMYMNWVKPYLRHIARLQMNEERLEDVDMIGAFEQSFLEVEALFAKPVGKSFDVVLLSMNFRTKPTMSFQQEGYNRGPIHVGQVDIAVRGYSWSEKVIDLYLQYRKKEDMYMLGVVDKSLQASMDALGDELEKYLAEAGSPKYADKVAAQKAAEEKLAKKGGPGHYTGMLEPFTGLKDGFSEMFSFGGSGSMFDFGMGKEKPKEFGFYEASPVGKMGNSLKGQLYQVMKNFKKARGMLSWG